MIQKRIQFFCRAFAAVLLVSFIGYYAGHFLLDTGGDAPVAREAAPETGSGEVEPEKILPPVEYEHRSEVINGNRQEIDILEVNPAVRTVQIKPMLSHDSVFGFENLSAMVLRNQAYAAINAGFFYEYGQPAGMVMIDGRMITHSTGKWPVFILHNGKAELKELDSRLWLLHAGARADIDKVNALGVPGMAVLYTEDFGTDNRAKSRNITAIIREGRIESVAVCEGPTDIPRGGMLLTFYEPWSCNEEDFPIQAGEPAELEYNMEWNKSTQAYECGSWIVKEGKLVAGERDEWVGVLTNWDPRTAVGIKDDGKVVLLTVDGRQPGHSIGLTAHELGEFLLSCGVRDAAMLDGGASTEMIIENRIVNRPSFKGQERPLGGGLMVKLAVDN